MKERPILFSGPMVRAILDGRKTQTRRILKPVRERFSVYLGTTFDGETGFFFRDRASMEYVSASCPYGTVGDRLWVRETVRAGEDDKTFDRVLLYPADDASIFVTDEHDLSSDNFGRWWVLHAYNSDDPDITGGKNVPSIHMPRWASRLLLEITDVRVQRLQQISEDDARAEGAPSAFASHNAIQALGGALCGSQHRYGFADLWDQINAERAGADYTSNPWVWAVTFKVVSR